ncbi:MAG TPA: hypothetical protein ENM98_04200, partial [Halothiobacillaceae bacterium]|nr:hypothetical protein [Halothiobacillaceae bacterium]
MKKTDNPLATTTTQIVRKLLNLSRLQKTILATTTDFIALPAIAVLSVWIRLGEITFLLDDYWLAVILLPFMAIPIFLKHGLYRSVIRCLGHRFALTVFISVSSLFLAWSALIFFFDLSFPRSAIIISWLLALLYITGSRLTARWLLNSNPVDKKNRHIVIFGAGSSGQQLLTAMQAMPGIKVVGFLDDDEQLQKHV